MPSPRDRAADLSRLLARRNRREWLAAGFVLVALAAFFRTLPDDPVVMASVAETVLATVAVSGVLWRWGRPRGLDAALPDDRLAEALRRELSRQGTLLLWAPAWYVVPLVGGIAGFFVGVAHSLRQEPPLGMLADVGVFGLLVAGLNVVAGLKLRREAASV
jgi:hypothetical protein